MFDISLGLLRERVLEECQELLPNNVSTEAHTVPGQAPPPALEKVVVLLQGCSLPKKETLVELFWGSRWNALVGLVIICPASTCPAAWQHGEV